jgi:hypothetical protein
MKHLKEHDLVREWLGGLLAGSAISFDGLTMIPLTVSTGAEPDWLLLDEALALGAAEVAEVSQAGAVPTLYVTNAGPKDVLLLDGEELVGAKQNRILNTTVLVRSSRTVSIPVSCVEQGRWAYRSRRFASGGRSLYASIRRKKAAQVHASLQMRQAYLADQADIWSELSERAANYRVQSPSSAMADVFIAHEHDVLEYQRALAALPLQVGALVYEGGDWMGLDLLPGARLFAGAWPKLVSGYAMDALGAKVVGQPTESATRRLDDLLNASVEVFPAVGDGNDCRFRGTGVLGAALLVDGIVGHLMAFPD